MIRVATYIHQMPLALDMVKDASDKGYETTLNLGAALLMAVSTVPGEFRGQENERWRCYKRAFETWGLCTWSIALGSLYSEQIRALCNMFFEY